MLWRAGLHPEKQRRGKGLPLPDEKGDRKSRPYNVRTADGDDENDGL